MSIIKDYISGLNQCLGELSEPAIEEAAEVIFEAWKKGKHIFIMGNGGSATTASHFVCDLQKTAAVAGKPRIRVISLTDNPALTTAFANDVDYGAIFEEQLVDRLEPGDVVIGISASGNSTNVLRAVEFARNNGAITIGLVGCGGNKLKGLVHKSVVLSSQDFGQVEDLHLILAHILSYLVRQKIRSA